METTKKRLNRRTATCVATLTAAGLSLGVVACGGSDSEADASGSATNGHGDRPAMATGGHPGGGPMLELTRAQQKCLKAEGVDLPSKPSGDKPPAPPTGADKPDPEQMQAAAEACDIEMPKPPRSGPPAS